MPSSTTVMQPSKVEVKEKLLDTAVQHDGFFIARWGTLLKEDRYKIIRKLSQDHRSNTFLVEDLQSTEPVYKYLAAKILSINATEVNGYTHEREIFSRVSEREAGYDMTPPLPILRDHFYHQGLHGGHYCFLTDPLSINVHGFRLSAPTGRLGVHIVKPIVAWAVEGLEALHRRKIIHADIKAENLMFLGPDTAGIEETIDRSPPLFDDTTGHPILQSQPFQPGISWDVTPYIAETIHVNLNNFDTALWADKPKPLGDIGAFALRAPENIIRAECGKEIDIWAVGCMTYELLAGEDLFQPQDIPGLTPDESLLLLQFAITGETLSKDVIDQSRARDKFFDREGHFIKSTANVYPNQSIEKRLTERCGGDLTERRISAAARFISDCLRLNPRDRPTVDELSIHSWLGMAFMGCADHD